MIPLPIRVLIAEDHLIARVGVGTIVETQADMQVVAEAATGAEAVRLHERHRPDVTLMDIRMPVMGGVEAMWAIRERAAGAIRRAQHVLGRRRDPAGAAGRRERVPHQGCARRRAGQDHPAGPCRP